MLNAQGRLGSDFGANLMYGRVIVGDEGAELLDFLTSQPIEDRLEAGTEVELGIAQTGSWHGDGSPTGNMYCYREVHLPDGRMVLVDQKWLVEIEPPVYEDQVLD